MRPAEGIGSVVYFKLDDLPAAFNETLYATLAQVYPVLLLAVAFEIKMKIARADDALMFLSIPILLLLAEMSTVNALLERETVAPVEALGMIAALALGFLAIAGAAARPYVTELRERATPTGRVWMLAAQVVVLLAFVITPVAAPDALASVLAGLALALFLTAAVMGLVLDSSELPSVFRLARQGGEGDLAGATAGADAPVDAPPRADGAAGPGPAVPDEPQQ